MSALAATAGFDPLMIATGTIMVGILGTFAWLAGSAIAPLFKQKHYFAALCSTFMSLIWGGGVVILAIQLFFAWLVIAGVAGIWATYYFQSEDTKDSIKHALLTFVGLLAAGGMLLSVLQSCGFNP